jgi:hypothetical protein
MWLASQRSMDEIESEDEVEAVGECGIFEVWQM